MVKIFLEKRMVRLHTWHTKQARQVGAKVVRHKRGLHVDDVVLFTSKFIQMKHHPTVAHEAILRVKRHAPGWHPQHTSFVNTGCQVVWRHQMNGVAKCMQIGAKGFNGCGDTIHAREIDIGNKQDLHGRCDALISATAPRPRQSPD